MPRPLSLLALLASLCACGAAPAHKGLPPRLELHGADADVWASELFMSGTVLASAPPRRCEILVNAQAFEAPLERDTFSATVALSAGENVVAGRCTWSDGATLHTSALHYRVPLSPGELDAPLVAASAGQPTVPVWAAEGVVYGVIPPLFGAPPLDAVADSIDELNDLGISALWLSPVFEAAPNDYGYAVVNAFKVRDSLGGNEALVRLVEQAHARSIRVLLDLVPNHTSDQHPYYKQTLQLGERSHYYDFYDRDAQHEVTHYWDWLNLPNLNFQNPEVVRYTVASAAHWIQQAAIDGYRVDAAWGVKQRRPEFWAHFNAELEKRKPELFMLAEASARDPYYLQHGFDAAYDWTDELGRHAWEHVFDRSDGIAARVHEAVRKSGPNLSHVFRFLNNNDTGERFITRHGEPMTRVATALLLTLPGIPCLYSFDEVGAAFKPYEHGGPLERPRNPELRTFHKQLVSLRRNLGALHADGFEPLHVGEKDEVLVYARTDSKDLKSAALVALNFGVNGSNVTVTLPESLRTRLTDLLGKRKLNAQGKQLKLQLAPHDVLVMAPAREGAKR